MKSYYIASRLENAPRVKTLKAHLDVRGWRHTYDWTVHGSVQQSGPAIIRQVADNETRGVEDADVVIVLLPGGRGTHTELGMAIVGARRDEGKRILLLIESAEVDFGQDGRTCAFYHHPLVQRVESWDELIAALLVQETA